jgi:hypothetical protein
MLWGRRQQFISLDGLLADVRAGRSRVLVIRGEAGIGKTALLGYAAETAQDFQVARAEGVESEMELASRRCTSCAGGCWAGWTSCPVRSVRLWAWRSACVQVARRIVSWSV